MNGKCKAAGCNKSEPKLASLYGYALADTIVAGGRLKGSGDQWTREPLYRRRGVRGCTLRMFHVVGREILHGLGWPPRTMEYKAEPKSSSPMQEVRGAHKTVCIALETWREERGPASVVGVQRSLGCPIAAWLGTEQIKSESFKEPYISSPSRTRK